MMFQLLEWRWIAGASVGASGLRISHDVSRSSLSITALILTVLAPEG